MTSSERFQQTSSILRRLRLIVAIVALLFLLDFAGVFVSSRSFLEGMRSIKETNTLYDLATRAADTLPPAGPLIRLQPGEREISDVRAVFSSSIQQALALLDSANAITTAPPAIHTLLADAREAAASMIVPAESAFKQVAAKPKSLRSDAIRGQLLLVGQFELEAREALRKVQIGLKRHGDQLFDDVYGSRHVPVLSALILGLLFLTVTTALGLSSARELDRSITNLRNATELVQSGDLKYRAPILEADEIGRLTASFNDMVSALEAAQARSMQAVQIRDEFLSIASHELKTPLTPLKIQIQSLLRMMRNGRLGNVPPLQLEKMIVSSDGQIQRLTRLVDELLDVSRIGSGRLTFMTEPFELSGLVLEVVERFKNEFTSSSTEVALELEPGVTGTWDRFRLEQVLTNLITNVLRYAAGKPLLIRTVRKGEDAVITVTDHGIGIAAQDQDRIFERFERAAPARNFGGLGLGLYITRQIVLQHGGDIQVASELGEGATFIVRLPLKPVAVSDPVAIGTA